MRKSETSRSSYKNRTLKLNSILIWPTLFKYQKNCCNCNSYLLISAANRRFFVRRKRAKFKNRKSSRYWTCDTSGQRFVSYSCIVKPNVTKSHGPLQVYLSTLSFLTAFLQLKKKKEKKKTQQQEKRKKIQLKKDLNFNFFFGYCFQTTWTVATL